MKQAINRLMLAVCIFLFSGSVQVKAQELLNFGETSGKSWTAKYYYGSNDNPPAENWCSEDFDDSEWGTLEGPIFYYDYKYSWANYSGYWLRRHFSVDDVSSIRFALMYYKVDDAMQVFLNGKEVFTLGITSSTQTVAIPDSIVKYLKNGDNVLAVHAYDTGAGDKFIDFGLYAQDNPVVMNGDFSQSGYWSGSYDRYSYDNNTEGYRYGRDWECYQTLNVPAGLYHLSANACGLEYYDNYNQAYAIKDNEVTTSLFVNDDEVEIPNAFSEPAAEDIYGSYRWETADGYVPYYVDRVPAAFNRDMYKVDVWSYVPAEDGNIKFGIHNSASNNINRWSAWDNFKLVYCSEEEAKVLLDSMTLVISQLLDAPQNANVKTRTQTLLENAKAANDYSSKSVAFVDMKHHEPFITKSIESYQRLENKRKEMSDSLKNVSMDYISPVTVDEANKLDKDVASAYKDGTYDNDQVDAAISRMDKMMERMSYTYLDIAVTVPGSLGDSILSKVENFVDVNSIKVSGSLNDTDLSTIQSRLTQLREVDMTDVNMTAMPNRFFYQHSALEIVNLPSKLETIGEYAFYQCYGIRNMEFPSTMKAINYSAFAECDNLQQVILPEGLTSIGEYAFNSCDHNKYLKLPSSLKIVSRYAFHYNIELEKIDFSEGLTEVWGNSFSDCRSLKSLEFPSSLYYIGDNSFANNSSLSDIEFNEGLYQIYDNAFYNCDALTEVTLPSSLVLCNASPFDYCDNLKKVTCLSIEPPYMTDQIPYGCNMSGRELYVPALSINTYKQTTGWDKFETIKPIDYLPENFTVLSDLHLTLPENIPADYKPNVSVIHDQKGSYYWQYGSLTVNGVGTLSMNSFDMFWDPNYQFAEYNRQQNYCSLVNNSHLRADNVSINMYSRNDRWSFVSFPFNVKVSDIETFSDGTTNWVIRKYDGQKRALGETSETWVRMNDDDILNAGEGYIIQGSRYIDNNWQEGSGFRMKAINDAKKNNIFNSADATVSLNEYESEFAHNRSWNLIGNPYPCYYDTRFMDFNAPITVWNMRDNTYTAYNPADDSYILCPGEAFFLQRPIENGTVVFGKEGRQTNRSVRNIESNAAKRLAKSVESRIIINLNLTDGITNDRTRIVFNENATMQYEMDKDASKFMSADPSANQIYTTADGIDYAINERPIADGMVQIGTRIKSEDFCIISIDSEVEGYDVILEDKLLGKQTVLTPESGYVFTAKSGKGENRFVLHLSQNTTCVNEINRDAVESPIYTVDGTKISKPSMRGVYIQNGKKTMFNK